MTGLSPQDHVPEYEVRERRRLGPNHNLGRSPGRILAGVLLAVVVIWLGSELLGIGPRQDPNGSVLSASGCMSVNVETVGSEPSVPLERAEDRIREHIDERGLRAEDGRATQSTFQPGSVYWAQYGVLSRPAPGRTPAPQSDGRYWILIFEDERDDRWYSRFWRNPSGPRFTVTYRVDQDRITSYCGGYDSGS